MEQDNPSTEILENGCFIEQRQEGEYIRVTLWNPDHSLSVSALRSPDYIANDPHYQVGIREQAVGLLLHGTER